MSTVSVDSWSAARLGGTLNAGDGVSDHVWKIDENVALLDAA